MLRETLKLTIVSDERAPTRPRETSEVESAG